MAAAEPEPEAEKVADATATSGPSGWPATSSR